MLVKRGVQAYVVCSFPFEKLGRTQAKTLGVPDLPLVLIKHPLGGIDLPEVKARVLQALPRVRELFEEHFQ